MAALFRLMSWSSRSRSTARPPPVMRKFRGLGTVPRQELPPEWGLRFFCIYPATEGLMAKGWKGCRRFKAAGHRATPKPQTLPFMDCCRVPCRGTAGTHASCGLWWAAPAHSLFEWAPQSDMGWCPRPQQLYGSFLVLRYGAGWLRLLAEGYAQLRAINMLIQQVVHLENSCAAAPASGEHNTSETVRGNCRWNCREPR